MLRRDLDTAWLWFGLGEGTRLFMELGEAQYPAYRFEVRVDLPSAPGEAVRLACTASIRHPVGTSFHLNKDMEIHQVLVDGKPAPFYRDAAAIMMMGVDTAVRVEAEVGQEWVITYTGPVLVARLPEMIERVTRLTPESIELAIYAMWYPRFRDVQLLTFEMEVDLPQGFIAVTNGFLEGEEIVGGRLVQRWRSLDAGLDIVLLASLRFQVLEIVQDSVTVEVLYQRLPVAYVTKMAEDLVRGLRRLTDLYGALDAESLLRLVYAPRGGWGYSRPPAIVVAEESALGQLDQPFSPASDFRYIAHEMAHFWWSIADMSTPDDWINEGLAEFSAYRVTGEVFGQPFAEHRAGEYRYNAARRQTGTPIAETTSDSPDREVNRYDRAALLFLGAQERFGATALDGFLRALYARFRGTNAADTQSFLEEVERQMGADARSYFVDGVYG
jgi:hypothetical protein